MREAGGHDPVGLPLEDAHALDLRGDEWPEVGRPVRHAPFIAFGLAGVQAQDSSVKIDLAPLEGEHFGLRAPTEGVGAPVSYWVATEKSSAEY